jgi:hypothetical protein
MSDDSGMTKQVNIRYNKNTCGTYCEGKRDATNFCWIFNEDVSDHEKEILTEEEIQAFAEPRWNWGRCKKCVEYENDFSSREGQ